MNTPPINRDDEIFWAALELPGAERAAYLDAACGSDCDQRRRVEALLASHEAPGFMPMPAAVMSFDIGHSPGQFNSEKAGDYIGSYRLTEQIGEGGFGAVWLAEQEQPMQREVALKILKPGMDSREVIGRFEHERQALAMMEHPSIAKVLDAGATDLGRPYFVMELVRGKRITEFCDEARLSMRERLQLFVQVCNAVQHAHQKGVIHRDLKPSNILVTMQDGVPVPKVIDFGVAKATQARLFAKTIYTKFEQMIGTPLYMSPEQAEMSSNDVDTRSDIYSLGVLLYELLTGRTPFDSEQLMQAGLDEMRRVIREEEPKKPSTALQTMVLQLRTTVAARRHMDPRALTSLVRGDLDWIVMKALEKDRNRRYETANGLALDIQRFLTHEPITARPPSFGYRAGKLFRKHKGPVLAVAAVFATLITGMAASTVLYLRERSALDRESRQRQRAEAGEQKAHTESAKYAEIARVFKQMIEGVKPEEARGADKTLLLSLLSSAETQIATKLTGQPEVEASLRSSLASTYHSLGLFERAQQHYEAAVRIYESVLGPENQATLASRGGLAVALYAQNKLDEAKEESRKAYKISERLFGPDHPITLANRITYTIAYTTKDDEINYEDTAAEYQKLLEDYTRVLGLESPGALRIRDQIASSLRYEGKLDEAEAEHREVAKIRARILGAEHPDTLRSRRGAAYALNAQKKLAEAESEMRDILKVQKGILGPDHPDALETRGAIARVMARLDRFQEAEDEYRDVFEKQRRLLGPTFPDTLTTQGRIADTLFERGKFQEAEKAYRDLIEIETKVSGPNHRYTLSGRSGLAVVLDALGKYKESEDEFRVVLNITDRIRGPEDPATLRARMSIAFALDSQGKFAAAEEVYREVMETQTRVLGTEHRDTLKTRANYGGALYNQHKYAEANKELQAVLATRERLLGPAHADTISARGNWASILDALGKSAEAEAEHRKVAEGLTATLGPEHPRTLLSRMNVGVTMRKQKKYWEAEIEIREVLKVQERLLGPEHPAVCQTRDQLLIILEQSGSTENLLEMARLIAEGRRNTLGPEHPDALQSAGKLAVYYARAGRNEEALKLREEVLQLNRKVLGLENPETLGAMTNLADSYADTGRLADAVALQEEALAIKRRVLPPGHSYLAIARDRMIELYEKAGRKADADAVRKETPSRQPSASTATAPTPTKLEFTTGDLVKLEEALKLARKNAPEHKGTIAAMINLANSYEDAGRNADALKLREEALPLSEKINGAESPATLAAMTNLAISYRISNRASEAIALQEKSLSIKRRVLPPGHPFLRVAIKNMLELCEQSGRKEEAEALRKELTAKTTPPIPATQPATGRQIASTTANANPPPGARDIKKLEESLELARKSGPESAATISAIIALASAHGADGSGNKAIKLGEEALALARRALPANDERTVAAMKVLIPLYKSVDLSADAHKLEDELAALNSQK